MPIDFLEFADRHPLLTHCAARGLDPDLLRDEGLLSVTELVRCLADDQGQVRWRPVGVKAWRTGSWRVLNRLDRGFDAYEVQSPDGRAATINDQGPLRSFGGLARLEERGRLLDGLTPADWIETLNARVYFWADPKLRERFLVKYASGRPTTISLETTKLPDSLRARLRVSRINGGAARGLAKRGRATYTRLEEATFTLGKIKEITIEGRVSPTELAACGATVS